MREGGREGVDVEVREVETGQGEGERGEGEMADVDEGRDVGVEDENGEICGIVAQYGKTALR